VRPPLILATGRTISFFPIISLAVTTNTKTEVRLLRANRRSLRYGSSRQSTIRNRCLSVERSESKKGRDLLVTPSCCELSTRFCRHEERVEPAATAQRLDEVRFEFRVASSAWLIRNVRPLDTTPP